MRLIRLDNPTTTVQKYEKKVYKKKKNEHQIQKN